MDYSISSPSYRGGNYQPGMFIYIWDGNTGNILHKINFEDLYLRKIYSLKNGLFYTLHGANFS